LLELIVINLGLQAGILTPILFAMFVFHALLLTFITAPMTALIIPKKHLQRMIAAKTATADSEAPSPESGSVDGDSEKVDPSIVDEESATSHRNARQN
jgi:hypothetical protein